MAEQRTGKKEPSPPMRGARAVEPAGEDRSAGREALRVLIVDDGYTALTRLQGKPAGRAEPIYRTLSTGVGAVAHLTKPFSPGQLTEMVRRVLDAAREGRRP